MNSGRHRLSAVSYLNTLPLIWGMMRGPQREAVDLRLELPSACAESVRERRVEAGLIPVIETARQGLAVMAPVGIACQGPVESILLVSAQPPSCIRTLAVDTSSRTSAMLARIILKHRYHAEPESMPMSPDLAAMLARADAGLIIGDPALLLDRSRLPPYALDLGQEWWALTALPMVFAVWAGRGQVPESLFTSSFEYGAARLDEYAGPEAARRGIPEETGRRYLTRAIRFEIGPAERRGMAEYLRLAAILEEIPA